MKKRWPGESEASRRQLVFLAVNASYAHSNLAARFLRASADAAGLLTPPGAVPPARPAWVWQTLEVTIQDSLATALAHVVQLQPTLLATSFYLFNRNFLLALLSRFKLLFPQCPIVAGGPEFLGDNRLFLERYPFVDVVIRGEGEGAFREWLRYADRPAKWTGIAGLCARIEGHYLDNGQAPLMQPLDALPTPYADQLDASCKPFILMETARGCANQCAFCTSAGVAVRHLSLERVRQDLQHIAASGIPEVRLTDRTFNDRPARCLPLLRMFRDEFKNLRFHLELDPARLTPAMVRDLAPAAPGRFHLEVGIQSLNPRVLRNLRRQGTARRALAGLRQLCHLDNLQVHVDLLAGLPGATLADLWQDLATLTALRPSVIQLETLKLLPGTRLAAERSRWGILASVEPPYEVLRTATMSWAEMETARRLSRLVDWFYNAPDLQGVVWQALETYPRFWQDLLSSGSRQLDLPQAPSLENRFRWLDDLLRRQAPALMPALHYAWLKCGFSAQHGLCAVEPWKGAVPPEAILIEGQAAAPSARRFLARLEQVYLFVYGAGRRPVAIYRLPPASR